MKILVIGSGGREHALVWALGKSASRMRVFCAPGNAGISELAECVPIQTADLAALCGFALDHSIDLTIVGGEAPVAAGIVDLFAGHGLRIVGVSARSARLESSKSFAKGFMTRHGIPTARYRIATSASEARAVLRRGEFGPEDSPVVIKADGLAGGKGVVVASCRDEAVRATDDMMVRRSLGNEAARQIVIEDFISGEEVSLLLFTDGNRYVLMPAARDHKRVGDGDTGLNTGGMGAITDKRVVGPKPLERIVREIVEPTLEGIRAEGFDYRGVLFIGLMLTQEGPRVLEYNVRFGDPEAQAILVRLRSDLLNVFDSVERGCLEPQSVQWSAESSACVILAAPGYPARPETGSVITGLDLVEHRQNVHVFHAGTSRSASGDWHTAGGRVLGITAASSSLEMALSNCYKAAGKINWTGMHYRSDIGRFAANLR